MEGEPKRFTEHSINDRVEKGYNEATATPLLF